MKAAVKFIWFIFILSPFMCKGQYHSAFGKNYTEWNFIALYCDAGFVETFIHDKDTVIQNVSYHVLHDFGLLRESQDHSKLWFRDFNEEEERLIMDLNLNKGDTFSFHLMDLAVDTTYLENNRKIIEFDFIPYHCGYYEKLRFVEGRGLNFSFRFALSGLMDDMWLLRCQTKDSVSENFLTQYFRESCREGIIATKNVSEINFTLYPNPADNQINISFDNAKNREIEILDFSGFRQSLLFSADKEVKADISALVPGIYYIQIIEHNTLYASKFLKL